MDADTHAQGQRQAIEWQAVAGERQQQQRQQAAHDAAEHAIDRTLIDRGYPLLLHGRSPA